MIVGLDATASRDSTNVGKKLYQRGSHRFDRSINTPSISSALSGERLPCFWLTTRKITSKAPCEPSYAA